MWSWTRRRFLTLLGAAGAGLGLSRRLESMESEVSTMEQQLYTHAMWKVRPGDEDAFIDAWDNLARVFSDLPAPPIRGVLIRSLADPSLFYSFGPWRNEADVQAMRANAQAQEAIGAVVELCETATPGAYSVVRDVTVGAG